MRKRSAKVSISSFCKWFFLFNVTDPVAQARYVSRKFYSCKSAKSVGSNKVAILCLSKRSKRIFFFLPNQWFSIISHQYWWYSISRWRIGRTFHELITPRMAIKFFFWWRLRGKKDEMEMKGEQKDGKRYISKLTL